MEILIKLKPKHVAALERLANEVNLPAQRLAELFVEDSIVSYGYRLNGNIDDLRDSIAERAPEASQPEADPELCQRC